MSQAFDPYHIWLGIPANEQPPNHYRLLGLQLFETIPDVIESAADRQMQHLRSFQSGPHGADSQRLLNEVSKAKICLLNPGQKQEYDQQLRAKLAPTPAAPPHFTPVPVPVASIPIAPAVPIAAAVSYVSPPQPLRLPKAAPLQVVQVVEKPDIVITSQRVGVTPSQPHSKPKRSPLFIGLSICGVSLAAFVVAVVLLKTIQPGEVEIAPPPKQRTPEAPQSSLKPLPGFDQRRAPAPKAAGPWIDLLAWAEGVDWAPRGIDWNSHLESPPTKDGITLKAFQANRYPLPAIIDGDYDLEVEFTRYAGSESVNVFFPIGEHNLHLELGAHTGGLAGVHWTDGHWENETARRPCPIINGQLHRVQIHVQREGEKAAFNIDWDDQKDFTSWYGPYSSLTNVDGSGWKLSMIQHPWLGSWDNRVTFSKVQVRMTSGSLRRDSITTADRSQDLKDGLIRLTAEPATASSVGWGRFVANQVPLEGGPAECERRWPMIAHDFAVCPDFYGAHAPSRLKCPIPKSAKSFTAIGYNASSRTTKFVVVVDGNEVYDTGVAGFAAINLNLPAGSATLELVVDPLGDLAFDHSYWCYPRFHAVPIANVTDPMREGNAAQAEFKIESHTQHRELTHNTPVSAQYYVPLALRSIVPCHEFLYAVANSTATYAITPNMTRFTAIGYCVMSNSVKFEVWADAKRIYESPQAGVIPIDVRLPPGAKTLELKVNNLGNTSADHSTWCYPRLHAK